MAAAVLDSPHLSICLTSSQTALLAQMAWCLPLALEGALPNASLAESTRPFKAVRASGGGNPIGMMRKDTHNALINKDLRLCRAYGDKQIFRPSSIH
jgi:hypothetical protein